MRVRNKIFMTTAILLMMGGMAHADETTVITTKSTVSAQPMEDTNIIDFSSFDHNHDNILSMAEVGEKLFYIFDTDGNEIIDNIEFEQNSMMTITPMEKETITLVDHHGDGTVEHTTYTYETFLKESQLIRFADDHDGLSPREFIGTSFLIMDDNNDKAIDLQEWKEGYITMTIPPNAEQERYNN